MSDSARTTEQAAGRVRLDELGIEPPLVGQIWLHMPVVRILTAHRSEESTRHLHAEVEMNLAYRGTAVYLVGQHRYRMAPGVLIWLFPGQDHLLIDQSDDFAMWILVARPAVAAKLAASGAHYAVIAEDKPEGHFARRVAEGELDRLLGLFDLIDSQADDAVCYNQGIEYATAAAWLAFQHAAETESVGLHPAVESAVRLLRTEDEAETIDVLARRAGLSPSRLSRVFLAQVGISIVEFRNANRLERFHRIRQRAPHLSISAAALDAGFGSYAQFYRVFKAAHGRGPIERNGKSWQA
jgi:AraC-like DNA-binding protein